MSADPKTTNSDDAEDLASPDIEPDVIRELALAADAVQSAARHTRWGFVSDHCANALGEIKRAIHTSVRAGGVSEQRTDYGRLRALAEAAAPGPWRECGHNRGGCKCGFIWSIPADAPIAEAIVGEWGDRWPALRKVKRKPEAYMAEMIYGEIMESLGKANAAFIAAANPNAVISLLDEIDLLRRDAAHAGR